MSRVAKTFFLVVLFKVCCSSTAVAQGGGGFGGLDPRVPFSVKNKTLKLSELSSLAVRYDGSESSVSSVSTKIRAKVLDSSDEEIKAVASGTVTVFFYDMDYPVGSQGRRVLEICRRTVEHAHQTDIIRLAGDFEILPLVKKIFVRKVQACQVASEDTLGSDGVKGAWYNAQGRHCEKFCQSLGGENVASSDGFKCASGEQRPTSAKGKLRYTDCWGDCSQPRGDGGTSSVGNMCYGKGQKRDNDRTDITAGCFCNTTDG